MAYLCRWRRGWTVRQPPRGRPYARHRQFSGLAPPGSYADRRAFFAFSDQDDVWLSGKALPRRGRACRSASRPAGTIFLCASPGRCQARPGRPGARPAPAPGFPTALTQNLAPGCCMMLNRAAAELIDATPVPEGTWHDWWAYIVVAAYGGTVIAGNTPDILYRQHSANLVGEPLGFWSRTLGAARRGRSPFMTIFWRHIAALRPVRRRCRRTRANCSRSSIARTEAGSSPASGSCGCQGSSGKPGRKRCCSAFGSCWADD